MTLTDTLLANVSSVAQTQFLHPRNCSNVSSLGSSALPEAEKERLSSLVMELEGTGISRIPAFGIPFPIGNWKLQNLGCFELRHMPGQDCSLGTEKATKHQCLYV